MEETHLIATCIADELFACNARAVIRVTRFRTICVMVQSEEDLDDYMEVFLSDQINVFWSMRHEAPEMTIDSGVRVRFPDRSKNFCLLPMF